MRSNVPGTRSAEARLSRAGLLEALAGGWSMVARSFGSDFPPIEDDVGKSIAELLLQVAHGAGHAGRSQDNGYLRGKLLKSSDSSGG